MVKFVQQKEIEELSSWLTECGIIPCQLVFEYLKKKGKTPAQITAIVNQMVKRKLAYYDESKEYLRVNKGMLPSDLSQGNVKALWLLLDILDNVNTYFIFRDTPHVLAFFNEKSTTGNPCYDVFYIPYGSEKLNSYILKNKFQDQECIQAFIILDSIEQAEQIDLPDNFVCVSFIVLSDGGKTVSYYAGNEEEEEEVENDE